MKHIKSFLECVGEVSLPRKSTIKKLKKLGKKSGVNKSTNKYGGENVLTGKISTKESLSDFIDIETPINSNDFKLFKDIVNRGIDSHLEGFVKSKFEQKGQRYIFKFHKSELPILLRRLQETSDAVEDNSEIENWIEGIKNYKNED